MSLEVGGRKHELIERLCQAESGSVGSSFPAAGIEERLHDDAAGTVSSGKRTKTGGRKKNMDLFAKFTWASSSRPTAIGGKERASLTLEIDQCKYNLQKMDALDTRKAEGERVIAIMREKLAENIAREGRRTVLKKEADEADVVLHEAGASALQASDALEQVGKVMFKALEKFSFYKDRLDVSMQNAVSAGQQAVTLCNRVLDGESDAELEPPVPKARRTE